MAETENTPGAPGKNDIVPFFEQMHDKASEIELAVIIPTFRRPEQIIDTMKSVASQETSRKFVCIVMENDPDRNDGNGGNLGADAAKKFIEQSGFQSIVVLANRRGNCSAYNAGFHTALTRFENLKWVLIIDDDETARPGWIDKMTSTAEKLGVDIVGAPQDQHFEDKSEKASKWMDHPVFLPPYNETNKVPILYSSGNLLISSDALRTNGYPYLDERFNFLGGGDSDFCARSKARGYTFGWCKEAAVDEVAPMQRTTLRWIKARSLRNGSISALIEKKAAKGWGDTFYRWYKTLGLLVLAPFKGIKLWHQSRSFIIGTYHVDVAWGRMLLEFGYFREQYRNPEEN